jgi:hypothetical protein
MDDETFEAHLALHGLVRYDGQDMNLSTITRVYVDDEDLVEIFRNPLFIRIDQYGPPGWQHAVDARAVPGFEEFGALGMAALYTLKKNHG